ncbi:MAG: HPr family phosphocarrier protein [Clostridia bacterium]|nr:HPr family phosphocarrier protein [Clostridia bacterium]
MVQTTVKVADKMGLHMRPANVFVTAMTKYKSDITIVFGEKEINAKSIMNLMAACIKYDSEITIRCEGEDEEAMLAEAAKLIEEGMD